MTLEPGRNLLHYRIVEKLGEGGMGAVWRAVDTHLDREVAIKVLPPAFSDDPDRLARFDREAKLLASLNHPNIAGVYGFHPSAGAEGLSFLAMELVDGEDLAQRLERGPLGVEATLSVSRQIAEALEAAHAGGVIHRDLKPANIKRTPEGRVKVLDFGLAKALEPVDASGTAASASLSPTLTSAGTRAGVILGTAAYMSPEQARGKPLDRRTDLWSLGCVLYECLTGAQLFSGETVSDSLAAILRKDPDWSALPETTPPMVRLLLRRLLTREPNRRLQDAGDARLELEQAIEDPQGRSLGLAPAGRAGSEEGRKPARVPWAVAFAALAAALFFALRGDAPTAEGRGGPLRLTIPVPESTVFGDSGASPPAFSPDGRLVVFGATDENGRNQLWLRPLESFTARPLSGTEDAQYAFWSPDSRQVGFFQHRDLKRIAVATGQIQTVGTGVAVERFPRGASWHENGTILFVPDSNAGVHLIDASGGEPRRITEPDPDVPDSSHRWPVFLPDGEHFLFVNWTNELKAQEQYGGIYAASVDGGTEPVRVAPDPSGVLHVSGHLIVMRGANLVALPFDEDALRVTGDAVVIATGALRSRANGHVAVSASDNGNLVYATSQAHLPAVLRWYDRDGTVTDAAVEPASYRSLDLSPDAGRAVASIPGPSGDGQLWVLDLVRGVSTRLANETWSSEDPVWDAGGNRVMYGSQAAGGIDFYTRLADGSGDAEPVFVDGTDKFLYDWSRDGRFVAYSSPETSRGTPDIWIFSTESEQAQPLLVGDTAYIDVRFSPDGRWIAYVADDTGSWEVFVQAFDADAMKVGARWRLSTAGGLDPHWRSDGREIVYLDPDRRMMAVSIDEERDGLKLGTPRELFAVNDPIVDGDATGDHQRFLIATRDEAVSEPLHVILDWTAELD